MRYRFSIWDLIFVLLLGALVGVGIWVMGIAPDKIPLHYNAMGQPDRWGPPSAVNVLVMPLLALFVTYPPIRLMDLYYLERKPESYGIMTNLGGGTGLLMAGVGFHIQLGPILSSKPGPGIIVAGAGLLYMYMGWLIWVTPPDRMPMNTGVVSNSPEGKQAMARTIALGFGLSGLVTIPASFLPGQWSMLSLGSLMLGPVIGLIIGLSTAPSGTRR